MPTSGIFFGDYTNITVHNNIIRPIWTRLHNGSLSIWTDVTPLPVLSSNDFDAGSNSNSAVQFPNPAKNTTYVSYKLHELSTVNLSIFDQQGRMVYSVLENEKREYGKYIESINIDELQLNDGTYFLKLTINGSVKTMKMIVVK